MKIYGSDCFKIEKLECLIIDDYDMNINEKLFYSIINHSKQLNNYIVVNSLSPIKEMNYRLPDLRSRANSFMSLGIDLPTDELLEYYFKIVFRKTN